MRDGTPVKRSYRSVARDRQTRERRLSVITAATRLFVEQGYGATTIEAVAIKAGVGRATVFASVGGKPSLMRAAYEVAVAGGDELISDAPDHWFTRLAEATTAVGVLGSYAAVLAEVYPRVAPVYESLRIAAGTDGELTELVEEVDAQRLTGARNIVTATRKHSALRRGLLVADAGDIVWALGDPALYRQLTVGRGWSGSRYETWLGEVLVRELLPPA